jgi:ppGpp synthetase/RelA/SpoT-type nucleotidyltranferase
MALLRDSMMQSDPVLHSVGENPELTPLQQERLRVYGDKVKVAVLPKLQATLEDIAQATSPDSFVRVTSRAKSADGLHEKVTRMQAGNQGRGTRPGYRLADVPDAAGGRIVVEQLGDLAKITSAIEETFRGNIFEKDNFYLNEKKSQRPYRVITYTVLQDNVPCEIQVMTLSSNISSDIDHNTVYKQLIGLDESERMEVTDWWRGVVAKELNDL